MTTKEHDTKCNALFRELEQLKKTEDGSPAYMTKLYELRDATRARLGMH